MFLALISKVKKAFQKLFSTRRLGLFSLVFLGFLALGIILITTPAVRAAGGLDDVNFISDWLARFTFMLSRLFLSVSLFLLTFIIQLAGYSGFIDSTTVTVGWVMVRDLVNMLFVIFLLVIAFGTILGLEQYEWKKLMVKFLLAAILVNFSRVICGLIIDAAQVVMITFVNGIASTAGGNLINAFSLDSLYNFSADLSPDKLNTLEVTMSAIGAIVFTGILMFTLFAIVMMLLFRIVVLWVLIVLSPLAFVMRVLPKTEKFGSEWWSEFGNHVVVGPILLFFIWLSFVTLGGGNIDQEIASRSVAAGNLQNTEAGSVTGNIKNGNTTVVSSVSSSGISAIMSWEKMANFAIAIGMLLAGIKLAQQFSVYGGDFLSNAKDFGKKVAMVASGVALGNYLYDRAAKPAAKWAAYNAPFLGGRSWVRKGKLVGGIAADYWQRFQLGRTLVAKGFDERKFGKGGKDGEGVSAKELRRDRSDIEDRLEASGDTERYKSEMRAWRAARGTRLDRAKRFLYSGVFQNFVQPGGRADARAQDWLEAAKIRKEIVEDEYSKSTFSGLGGGGRAKLNAKAVQAQAKPKSEARGKEKVDAKVAIMMEGARHRLQTDSVMQGHYEELDRLGGRTDHEAEHRREEIKGEMENRLKQMIGQGGMGYGLPLINILSLIKAETTAESLKAAETMMRTDVMGTSSGSKFFKAKAIASLAHEGHAAHEEDEQREAEMQAMAGIDSFLGKELGDTIRNLRSASALLNSSLGKNPEESKQIAALTSQVSDFDEKIAEQKRIMAKMDPENDKDALEGARTDLDSLENSRASIVQNINELLGDGGGAVTGTADASDIKHMLDKMTAAFKEGAAGDRAKNEADDMTYGEMAAFRAMFGNQAQRDIYSDRQNLKALEAIKTAIQGQEKELAGGSFLDARAKIQQLITTQRAGVNADYNAQWVKASRQSPAAFAARASSMRDFNYAFYRGKKQEIKDNAVQAEVWDKMGIDTPTSAGQEAIAEELYAKNFKGMNYDQVLAAYRAHQAHVTKKGSENLDERDRLIGMAIMNKMMDESWVDDGSMPTYSQNLGISSARVKGMRDKRLAKITASLSAGDLNQLGGALKDVGVNPQLIEQIRRKETGAVDRFMEDFGRKIEGASNKFLRLSAKDLALFLQGSDNDQFRDLLRRAA